MSDNKIESPNQLGLNKFSDLNTWDNAKVHRKTLSNSKGHSLESAWDRIKGISTKPSIPIDDLDLGDRLSTAQVYDSPLTAFRMYMLTEVYPPPELLLCINECFELYYRGEGDLSLEDVFFGKLRTGSGNMSRRQHQGSEYADFHLKLILEKTAAKRNGESVRTQIAAANEYLQDSDRDPASFLRSYRDWKKKRTNKG